MGKRGKVLVVDDSKLMRSIVKMLLEKGGYEVCEAQDGKEALTVLIRDRDISLVTLDVEMPVMNGFEACRHIRMNGKLPSELRNIPVLFITSCDSLEDRRKGFELGASDFMLKESLEAGLLPAVERILTPGDRLAGVRALVVDDSLFARKIVVKALLSSGVLCTEAEHGRAAYELLQTCPGQFDLVILDLDMPEMNGLELTGAIRKELGLADLPVLMLSANENKVTQLELFRAGATDYLTKPFIKEELLGRITSYLEAALLKRKLREAEKRAETAEAAAENAGIMRRELLQLILHDQGNPVMALGGMLDTVGDSADMFQMFREEMRKSVSVLEGLEELARKVWGSGAKLELDGVMLRQALQAAAGALQTRINDRHITVRIEVDEGLAGLAEELSLTYCVFGNILSNAIKFSSEGGLVDVFAETGEHTHKIVFRDHGEGMGEALIKKQLDAARKYVLKPVGGEYGIGFGLIQAKKFVDAYGGSLSIRSWSSGKENGTEVTVELDIC